MVWVSSLTTDDTIRLFSDNPWYSLWLRTVGSLGLMRWLGISGVWLPRLLAKESFEVRG